MATHSSREYVTPGHEREQVTLNGVGMDDDGDASSSVLEPGVYVDRYRILDVLGTGGIGVVYAAFDEALGRNVALKLLRPSTRSARKFERRRARLIREAQALARLSHPNVVPVYEVGMFEDRVFVAMEYIEGSTMRRWLQAAPRSWREILDKHIQAGRGLAAAHAADIVHRDFKPENVLVGEDGRVRVLDFGLATPIPDGAPTGRYATISFDDLPTKNGPQQLTESVSALITAHGKVMGTPAYMSPEQSRGEPIDARSDQYSFCVALYEALFGERPQGPPTASARIRLHRRLSERGLSGKDVPQAVQRALERGLSVDPDDRFADMGSLLDALELRPPSRRRWIVAAALSLAGVAAASVAMLSPSKAELCPREDAALDGIWDLQVREQIRTRLTATNRPYADATWATVARELDRWSSRWLDARLDACEDTKLRNEQSPVLFDLRMACLDRQLNALAAVSESLAAGSIHPDEADAQLESALAAVLDLPKPERCERAALIGGGALLHEDPRLGEQLEDHRHQLARARGLLGLLGPIEPVQPDGARAKLDEALALVDEVIAAATPDGDPHDGEEGSGSAALLAEAKLLRGQILAATGKLDAAEDDLRRAVFLAQQHGHDTVTVDACAALVELLSTRGELDSAGNWAELGRATLARIGGDPHLEATLRFASARLARMRGQLDAALEDGRRVLEIREQLYGSEHVEVAKAIGEQVLTKTALGLHDEAAVDSDRALAILTAELGITHPEVGLAYTHDAALQRARGADHIALSKLLDAQAIFEIAYDQQHPRIVATYQALASVHVALDSPAEALTALERALELGAKLYGDAHPKLVPAMIESGTVLHLLGRDDEALARLDQAERLIAKSLDDPEAGLANAELALARGRIHADAGRLEQALAAYSRAHQLYADASDPDDELVGHALGLRASIEHRMGEFEAALAHQQQALALRAAALAEDAPQLALHLTWIGVGQVALGRHDEARAALTRALELLGPGGGARLRGQVQLALAEIEWAAGQQPQARELARSAIAELEPLGERAVIDLDAAKVWLRRHGG